MRRKISFDSAINFFYLILVSGCAAENFLPMQKKPEVLFFQ